MNAAHPTPEATWQRLQRYAACGCEQSFREIFEGHIGLVYHAALRLGQGDQTLAEEVAQTVFADLARKAAGFSPKIILPAWLHRHACLTTRQMLRSSRRRRARELAAARLESLRSGETGTEGPKRELAEHIDAALNALPPADREVLILRFMEGRDFREVGRILGISDDAAQKRATRGLERLRAVLARQGFAAATTAGVGAALGLPAAIPASAMAAMTAALPAVISGAGAAGLGLSTAGAGAVLFVMKPAVIAATAAVLAVGGLIVIPRLTQRLTSPPPPVVSAEKAPPPPTRPKVAALPSSDFRSQGKPRQHFPLSPNAAKSDPNDNEQYKEAFRTHPRTKIAEERVNALIRASKAFLDLWAKEYQEKVKEYQKIAKMDIHSRYKFANVSSLSEAQRDKAMAVLAELNEMEQAMTKKPSQSITLYHNTPKREDGSDLMEKYQAKITEAGTFAKLEKEQEFRYVDDPALDETQRAKAAAAVAELNEMERSIQEKRNQLEAFLQNMVFSERTSILAEIKNPSLSAPKTLTEASEAAMRTADASFANGDYQAAVTTLQPVLDSLPDAERGSAQWQVVLGQMIAGQDTAPSIQPMLQGSPEQALYALAAYAIQQGGWDEAQIWLDQAATSGNKNINTRFNQSLIHLGWMDAETGKLIPPPETTTSSQ